MRLAGGESVGGECPFLCSPTYPLVMTHGSLNRQTQQALLLSYRETDTAIVEAVAYVFRVAPTLPGPVINFFFFHGAGISEIAGRAMTGGVRVRGIKFEMLPAGFPQ